MLAFLESGNIPAFLECRKFSGISEIFLHFWSAGNFPALLECRKFSGHFWSAGNFPAFQLSASVDLYIINHFCSTLVPTLFSFSIYMSTFVGHMFLHFSFFSIYMSTFVGCMFLHFPFFSIYMGTFVGRMFLHL